MENESVIGRGEPESSKPFSLTDRLKQVTLLLNNLEAVHSPEEQMKRYILEKDKLEQAILQHGAEFSYMQYKNLPPVNNNQDA